MTGQGNARSESGAGGPIEAVIFDWGGTLADYAAIELIDMWRLAAHHLAGHIPIGEDEILNRLADVEARMWARTTTDARAASLSDLLAEATRELGADVTTAVLEEAGTRYLDAWTPHIVHDAQAVATLTALRARGLRIGLLSNTHWPPSYHEHFLERDGLGDGLVPDYLTRVQDGGFYGWPYSYIGSHPQPGYADRRPDLVKKAIVPDTLFEAHSAALGLAFYTGDKFPQKYRGGAFVGLHGSWNAAAPRGYSVAFVPFEGGKPATHYEVFMSGFWVEGESTARVIGRPVGTAIAKDGSLLVADDVANVIWRVSYTGN